MKEKLKTVMRAAKSVSFSTNPDDLLVFSRDASQLVGKALAVAWPENESEVVELVQAAHAEGVAVVPRGAGTGLAGGAVPDANIVVDLTRMKKVGKVDEAGKSCFVEAGAVLNDLNYELAKRKLFFPVIPSSHRVCTLGGMIATNAAGVRSVKYGKVDRWVKSLRVVDGEGKLVKADGAGEFAGSEGIFGMITGAELKLAPALGETSIDFLKFEKPEKMAEKALELRKEKSLVALELVDSTTAGMLGLGKEMLLLAEYEGDVGSEKRKDEIEKIWNIRDSAYPKLASEGYPIIEDPKIPLEKMAEFLLWLEGNKIPSFGHVALGILHPCFKFGEDELTEEMYSFVEMLGGEVTGEHGLGIRKKKFAGREQAARFERLKGKFDAKGLFNPGKLIGETKSVSKLAELGIPDKCSNCGMCRFNCPTLAAEMNESNSSRGRANLIRNGIPSEILLKCTLCKHCEFVCPAGVKLPDAIVKAREKVRTAYGEEMIKNIREYGNVYGKPGTKIKTLQCC